MSFPRYPAYKGSGVEWLADVPSHWEVKRLGHYFSERREKVSDRDFEPLSVTKNGVLPQLDTAAKTDDGDNRKLVVRGDFVINSRSDRKGSSGLNDRKHISMQDYDVATAVPSQRTARLNRSSTGCPTLRRRWCVNRRSAENNTPGAVLMECAMACWWTASASTDGGNSSQTK